MWHLDPRSPRIYTLKVRLLRLWRDTFTHHVVDLLDYFFVFVCGPEYRESMDFDRAEDLLNMSRDYYDYELPCAAETTFGSVKMPV